MSRQPLPRSRDRMEARAQEVDFEQVRGARQHLPLLGAVELPSLAARRLVARAQNLDDRDNLLEVGNRKDFDECLAHFFGHHLDLPGGVAHGRSRGPDIGDRRPRSVLKDRGVRIDVPVRLTYREALRYVGHVARGENSRQRITHVGDKAVVDARPQDGVFQVRVHSRKRARHVSPPASARGQANHSFFGFTRYCTVFGVSSGGSS